MNSKINCAMIKDLLPLYHDGVVSEESKAIIEEHLMQCGDCNNEYKILCSELPIESQTSSTKNRFVKMMSRKKTRQILVTILCSVLSCVLLVGAYFGQLQLPIVNVSNDEITVERVYRFETEEGLHFFVMYSAYTYGNSKGDFTKSKDTLVMNYKKPIIAEKSKTMGLRFSIIDCGFESGDNGEKIFDDIKTIKFGEEVIWTAEKDMNAPIPDYVYAYYDWQCNTRGSDIQAWTWDVEEGWMEAIYYDGTMTKWDFDGNILTDTHTKNS